MTDATPTIPRDAFSQRLRELSDNPGAIRATSTIQRQDFYGNAESWIVDTFRVDGREEIFLQRMGAVDPVRILLPADVTDAIARQRDRCVTVGRKRAARSALATKRLRGIDPAAALKRFRADHPNPPRRKARKSRKARKGAK